MTDTPVGQDIAALVVATFSTHHIGTGSRYAVIVLLAVAMGVQNATARKLAVPDLTTTVLTMTLTGVAGISFVTYRASRSTPAWTHAGVGH